MDVLSGKRFFDQDVQIYVHTYREPVSRRRHAHDFLEIAYVTQGSATHHVGRTSYPIASGDLCVISPHDSHAYTRSRDLEICYLLVGPRTLQRNDSRLRHVPGFREIFSPGAKGKRTKHLTRHMHLDRDSARKVEALLADMQAELARRKEGYSVLLESLLTGFFVAVSRLYGSACRDGGASPQTDATDGIVRKALAFMEQHYDDAIRLADIARCACRQPQYFCRVFRHRTGLTPIGYLTHIRIQRACDMLAHSSESVTGICGKVGFHDLSHFIRTFRKHTHMSPSQFRETSRKGSVQSGPRRRGV